MTGLRIVPALLAQLDLFEYGEGFRPLLLEHGVGERLVGDHLLDHFRDDPDGFGQRFRNPPNELVLGQIEARCQEVEFGAIDFLIGDCIGLVGLFEAIEAALVVFFFRLTRPNACFGSLDGVAHGLNQFVRLLHGDLFERLAHVLGNRGIESLDGRLGLANGEFQVLGDDPGERLLGSVLIDPIPFLQCDLLDAGGGRAWRSGRYGEGG